MGKSLTLDNLTWTTVQHILTLFFSLVCTVGPRKDIAGGSGQVGLKSTCHLALNECERDNSCSRYLDQGVYLDTVFVSIGQRYTYRVLQTIQMKLILLCVLAEPANLGSTKTALKFKYEIWIG